MGSRPWTRTSKVPYFSPEEELKIAKAEHKQIASELYYPEEVFDQIDNAKSINEISRIMATARNAR